MSDVVSDDELNALAAEYVLGTLDYEERKGANALLEVDAAFRGVVRIWERRFGDLHLMVESVEPDPQLWLRIRPKVPGIEQIATAIRSNADVPPPAAVAIPAVETSAPLPPIEAASPVADAAAVPPSDAAAVAEPQTDAVAAPAPAEGAAPAMAESPLAQTPLAETPPTPTPPAHMPITEVRPPAIAETELKLAELAALLPVAAEQAAFVGPPAPVAPPVATAEPTPEDGLHTHAPDLVPRGFVPPVPMMTRGMPVVVEKTVRQSARGWAAVALTMALIAVALAGLISAWRFFPERLPPQLRATTVLHLSPAPQAPAPKARPTLAPFDE